MSYGSMIYGALLAGVCVGFGIGGGVASIYTRSSIANELTERGTSLIKRADISYDPNDVRVLRNIGYILIGSGTVALGVDPKGNSTLDSTIDNILKSEGVRVQGLMKETK